MGGWVRLVGWESRILWHLSAASIIVSLFTYMLTFATLMFTGHLGSVPLAGASIASVGIQGLAYGIMVCICVMMIKDSLFIILLGPPWSHLFLVYINNRSYVIFLLN